MEEITFLDTRPDICGLISTFQYWSNLPFQLIGATHGPKLIGQNCHWAKSFGQTHGANYWANSLGNSLGKTHWDKLIGQNSLGKLI